MINKNTSDIKSGGPKKQQWLKGLIWECGQGLCKYNVPWDEKVRPIRTSGLLQVTSYVNGFMYNWEITYVLVMCNMKYLYIAYHDYCIQIYHDNYDDYHDI